MAEIINKIRSFPISISIILKCSPNKNYSFDFLKALETHLLTVSLIAARGDVNVVRILVKCRVYRLKEFKGTVLFVTG